MNAERLHALVSVLNREFDETASIDDLKRLCDALKLVVEQDHPNHQQQLATARKNLQESLAHSVVDEFSPTWLQALKEIGGKPYFGRAFLSTIEDILSRNNITLAVAVEEMEKLLSAASNFKEAITNIDSGFKELGIGDEQLSIGECEIGMLIPRSAVDNRLDEFAEELEELSFALDAFSELATGKKHDYRLKTISSSDLTIYLEAAVAVAAPIAFAIERLVATYKNILDIKKLRNELITKGVSEDDTKAIEAKANAMMEARISALTQEIVKKYSAVKDEHRRNELSNAIGISLNGIANRIDRGFNIEVRVEPLNEKEVESVNKDVKDGVETIQAATKNMQFLKHDGKSILRLPETCGDGGEKQKSKSRRKSKKS
ncbi:hypothetical protein GC207_06085 [bacterium]|nr:hypothetical protein [bacterium]